MENKILQNNAHFHPKLCLRYVDDKFCVLNIETTSDKFLDLLNEQYKNTKFTIEHGSETLSFLDIEVTINETKIYRKQTDITVTCCLILIRFFLFIGNQV